MIWLDAKMVCSRRLHLFCMYEVNDVMAEIVTQIVIKEFAEKMGQINCISFLYVD